MLHGIFYTAPFKQTRRAVLYLYFPKRDAGSQDKPEGYKKRIKGDENYCNSKWCLFHLTFCIHFEKSWHVSAQRPGKNVGSYCFCKIGCFSSLVSDDWNRYLKPKHDLFLIVTMFVCFLPKPKLKNYLNWQKPSLEKKKLFDIYFSLFLVRPMSHLLTWMGWD